MPRNARQTPAGFVYHALNRATARLRPFRKAADYAAFLRVFDEALDRRPIWCSDGACNPRAGRAFGHGNSGPTHHAEN